MVSQQQLISRSTESIEVQGRVRVPARFAFLLSRRAFALSPVAPQHVGLGVQSLSTFGLLRDSARAGRTRRRAMADPENLTGRRRDSLRHSPPLPTATRMGHLESRAAPMQVLRMALPARPKTQAADHAPGYYWYEPCLGYAAGRRDRRAGEAPSGRRQAVPE
jgi:hypothetical protein